MTVQIHELQQQLQSVQHDRVAAEREMKRAFLGGIHTLETYVEKHPFLRNEYDEYMRNKIVTLEVTHATMCVCVCISVWDWYVCMTCICCVYVCMYVDDNFIHVCLGSITHG